MDGNSRRWLDTGEQNGPVLTNSSGTPSNTADGSGEDPYSEPHTAAISPTGFYAASLGIYTPGPRTIADDTVNSASPPPTVTASAPSPHMPPASHPLLVGRSRRGLLVAGMGVTAVIALTLTGAGLFVFSPTNISPLPVPSPPAPPATAAVSITVPTNVTLTDSADGGSVRVSWVDSSGGKAPTVIAIRRSGETSPARQPVTVEAGQAVADIQGGLNGRFDYCFVVASLYPGPQIATAPEVCTKRTGQHRVP